MDEIDQYIEKRERGEMKMKRDRQTCEERQTCEREERQTCEREERQTDV